MPEMVELEGRLASLRREIADARRLGSTPTQLRKMQDECCAIWAAIERYKYNQALDLPTVRH